MTMAKRVLLGLSGGVDSAVSALMLQERGYEVTAARMSVYAGPDAPGLTAGCYGRSAGEDTASAEALARRLNIPFHVLDCAEAYEELVLGYFRREYLAGRTPNPCVRCNQTIKFGALWRAAEAAGIAFDFFATGHYARIERSAETGRPLLKRGLDPRKDQSYFLYRLSREQLARTLFPLGELTKDEVRRRAAAYGLAVHDRPDSQDFYGGDYVELLGAADREGAIVDTAGRVLGRHQGFWRYTPGQRRGLGVAGGVPLYVLRVIPERNEVVVGAAEENASSGCLLDDLSFLAPEPAPGTNLRARLRSSQPLQDVTAAGRDGSGRLRVNFWKKLSGLAPGQSLVLYQDDVVVGGGIILEGVE